ncbi:MAG: branched-chain amino acid aminotransferase [Rhodospirillales bacterium]|jgi:branched-chain amino acid aminotransferase|nr:branched-chain amino acid aminotransferase [Rhodospirillales bacterium]HJO72691.1 branched-chain amino acid aminotransferase [Rhodospirillales bacterium]
MAKTHHGSDGRVITFTGNGWREGSPPLLKADDHAVWLSSIVFDGARAFDGVAPDLDLHCARAVASARVLGLAPTLSGGEIRALAGEGIDRFAADAELYICPMFYATEGFITPDPDSTEFTMTIRESPLPPPDDFSACLSSFRRPARDMAPNEAKASCLYPNVARCIAEATGKGFDTAVILDPIGNVAEFAYSNLFMVKDGAVHTPAPNGTYLNGLTRQRVVRLLRGAGVTVVERAIDFGEVLEADEVFGSGNYYKVAPCTRIEGRDLQPGPLYGKARDLYFEWAHSG